MCLAVPGVLREIVTEHGLRFGLVDFSGVTVRVCLELVPEAQVCDFLLVHAGTALQIVDEQTALETIALIDKLTHADETNQP